MCRHHVREQLMPSTDLIYVSTLSHSPHTELSLQVSVLSGGARTFQPDRSWDVSGPWDEWRETFKPGRSLDVSRAWSRVTERRNETIQPAVHWNPITDQRNHVAGSDGGFFQAPRASQAMGSVTRPLQAQKEHVQYFIQQMWVWSGIQRAGWREWSFISDSVIDKRVRNVHMVTKLSRQVTTQAAIHIERFKKKLAVRGVDDKLEQTTKKESFSLPAKMSLLSSVGGKHTSTTTNNYIWGCVPLVFHQLNSPETRLPIRCPYELQDSDLTTSAEELETHRQTPGHMLGELQGRRLVSSLSVSETIETPETDRLRFPSTVDSTKTLLRMKAPAVCSDGTALERDCSGASWGGFTIVRRNHHHVEGEERLISCPRSSEGSSQTMT
ncbi:unnamed protein product [Pleuronectes platessa]|uniref:Uncharacterized protein n=1 Tax=Pleuronectes platessa TaxID=8262 RepID=A0A9N7YZ35_PLEPL|nr:unnamed protein product [Pleuronectes platessa]